MTIKHLVFSGGGPIGLIAYGAAKYLNENNFWNLKEIKSIYGTSVGAYIGILISLGYDWKWIDDYFIKRPWKKLIDTELLSLIGVYNKKGILGEKFINEIISPLLEAKNLSKDVTFLELYEYNKIEIHIFSTEMNGECMEKIDISYLSHPYMKITDGMLMSMAFPFVFYPVIIEDKCYVDGGILNNFPLNDCIENNSIENEILAFNVKFPLQQNIITEESTVINYLVVLLRKMKKEIDVKFEQQNIKHIVNCKVKNCGLKAWFDLLHDEKLRVEIIEDGYETAKHFLQSIDKSEE
tara:strand:+ start:14261 stop:15145 length:885 start_codon:yes stop_codon:yes gene_type:complete